MSSLLLVSSEFPPYRGGVAEVVCGLAGALHCGGRVTVRVLARHDDVRQMRSSLAFPMTGYPSPCWVRGRGEIGVLAAMVLLRVLPRTVLALDYRSQRSLSLLPSCILRTRRVWLVAYGSEVLLHAQVGRVKRRQRLFAAADGVIAISRFAAGLVREHFTPRRLEVVYPGIAESCFGQPTSMDRIAALRHSAGCGERPLLVCLGRLDPRKGQDTAIETVAALAAHGTDAHLVVLGTGADRLRLEGLCRRLGVVERVTFRGEVDDEEKLAWLDTAAVVLQPSRREGMMVEGLGLALAEAGARGRAVVSSRHGGIPEVIEDGVTGVLLEEGALVSCWVREVSALLRDSDRATRLGEAARESVIRKFRWEPTARRVEKLLLGGGADQ